MTLKFSRARGRVQPTPAICKRPPIPQPPGTPLEALAANLVWLGETDDGEPFYLAAALTLTRHPQLGGDHYIGTTTNGSWTCAVDVATHDDRKTSVANLYPSAGGISKGQVWRSCPTERQEPLDSGRIDHWTPMPPETKIELRVRG